MHVFRTLSAVAAAAAIVAAPLAAEEAAPAAEFTTEEVFTAYGWLVSKQLGVSELKFTEAEVAALARGIQLARAGEPSPIPQDKLEEALRSVLEPRMVAYRAEEQVKGAAEVAANRARQTEYFAELDKTDGIQKTASGLRYQILEPGSDVKPSATSTVEVHYTGRLLDGTVFDSSVERGQPVTLSLNRVIPGWTEGLQLVGVGGRIRLHIPSDLAYGDDQRPGSPIPPASALVFDVELIRIEQTP
jgi:FKBP-type peptidyl-prolyl cis-trans isomerase